MTVEALMKAVRAGDVAEVRAMLAAHPDLVNAAAAGSPGFTPLHHAVFQRSPAMARLLMESGANPHAGISPLEDATTPLTMAVERGYDDVASVINEEMARRPVVDGLPNEFRAAAQALDEDRLLALLESHPEALRFASPGDRVTVLHVSSAALLLRVAGWLLDHGADVNAEAADGSTPLGVAGQRRRASENYAEAVATMRALLQGRGASYTARAAVMAGDEEFLRARYNEDRLEPAGLLALAVDHDRLAILRFLLDCGLDPDARETVDEGGGVTVSSWGQPLYLCARQGKHVMAGVLLERGADPNGQVYASGTPLSEAFGQRDERMIALLESYGGRPNASMAGLYRRKDLALKLLAEHGDARLPDDGFSSGTVAEQLLGASARGGDPEIMGLAIARLDWPEGDLRWYGALGASLGFWNHWIGPWCHPEWDRSGYLDCFKIVLARLGPPVHAPHFGVTVLHRIVTMGSHVKAEERVQFAAAALDAGARMDARDGLLSSTPLGWACRWGREELVTMFLERGADTMEPEAEPWARPLHWARVKGHESLVRLLQRHGGA